MGLSSDQIDCIRVAVSLHNLGMIGIPGEIWIEFVVASIAVMLAPGPGFLFVAKASAASG